VTVSGSLAFGNQVVGATSNAQNILVCNNGSQTVTITEITSAGLSPGTLAQPTLPVGGLVLAAGTCQTLSFNFTPGSPGALTGTVTIKTDVAGNFAFPITGAAALPAPCLNITTDNFGSVTVGQTSAPGTFRLTNCGTAQLFGFSVFIDNPVFQQVTGLPGVLNPGQTATFQMTAKPTATGTATGLLTVNALTALSGVSASALLSVVGVAVPTPAPVLTITPTTLSVNQTVGSTSTRTVTICNTGTAPAPISSINVSGAPGGFTIASIKDSNGNTIALPITLGVNACITATISFTAPTPNAPDVGSNVNATVTVSSPGTTGSPFVVPITGTVNPATPTSTLTANPPAVDFGHVPAGVQSGGRSITLTAGGPTGSITTISSVTITGPNAANFVICGDTGGVGFAVGGLRIVTVCPKPAAGTAGAQSAFLTVVWGTVGSAVVNTLTVPLAAQVP